MSTSSKNSSKGAPEGSQPPPPKGAGSGSPDVRNASKEKPGEPQSSKVNENPEGPKTDKVSSEGTGGKKVFKPKDLKICWQEESQYWSIPEGDGPVELLKACWLDVSGEMPVTKGKAYEVSFMLSMNTEHSFGWEVPVTVMARIGKKGKYERKEIDLSKLSEKVKEFPPDKCRIEFKSDENAKNDDEKLYFGLYEVWTNKWKGGLRIHEAIVQEIPAGNNASTSNPRSDESRGKQIAAHDDSISTSRGKQIADRVEVQGVEADLEPFNVGMFFQGFDQRTRLHLLVIFQVIFIFLVSPTMANL